MAADVLLAPGLSAQSWWQRHLRSAVAVLLLVLVLLPFLWMVLMAFRPAADALELDLVFRPTLDAFRGLWQDSFARSFGNSLLVSVLSTALSMLLGVPAAYALSRWRFKARKQVALWVLCTRMAPPFAFTIPFFLAFRWLGLLDTVWALVLVYLTFNLAIVIWMMQGFFEAVPAALEEAAIEKDARLVGYEKMFGAGDLVCAAEKMPLHGEFFSTVVMDARGRGGAGWWRRTRAR